MLRSLYVIAIGLLFAGVVGMGVNAFYKSPTYPTCEEASVVKERVPEISNACKAQIDAYNEKRDAVDMNKSLIYIGISIIVIAVSIFGLGKIEVIGDGITMGGIFVLFVGLVQSFSTENDIYKFLASLAALAIVIFLSYWKFIKGHKVSEKI